MPTSEGYPVVYSEWLEGGEDAFTLLAYGHYDVQPVDPVNLWLTPPFESTVRVDNLYCLGASDDKGLLFAVIAAAEALLKTDGFLAINLKVMLEGEEEHSSLHTGAFVERHSKLLSADAVLICDEAVLDPETPLVMYGVRGTLYLEVHVQGPAEDLHSGMFGGAVDNRFKVLIRLLAELQDALTHRLKIPGLCDRVRPLGYDERELLARLPVTDEIARGLAGVVALVGEEGYTTLERLGVRPTLEIHGLPEGFTGAGKKTLIPSRAWVQVSMRLVPDRQPQEIAQLLERYLRGLAPPTVTLTARTLGASRPAIVNYREAAIQVVAQALERGFGAVPLYMRSGGSMPVFADLQEALRVPTALVGFGMSHDSTHAPNEKMHPPNLQHGIQTLRHYFSILSGLGGAALLPPTRSRADGGEEIGQPQPAAFAACPGEEAR